MSWHYNVDAFGIEIMFIDSHWMCNSIHLAIKKEMRLVNNDARHVNQYNFNYSRAIGHSHVV